MRTPAVAPRTRCTGAAAAAAGTCLAVIAALMASLPAVAQPAPASTAQTIEARPRIGLVLGGGGARGAATRVPVAKSPRA